MGADRHRLAQASPHRGHRILLPDGRALEPSVRYVSVDGAVSRIEPGTDAQLEEVTRRYLSGDAAENYLKFARENLGENVVIYMQPQHWLSADMGSF